ncbi:DMT family transporter [Kitasatospora sp. RB6PN24]|uniref:DMT family transporter n=1 Tax=Kitasatospora humi TaxID=2893891 RepID=UPI001E4F0B18|nr:DMT family transporter [Kitasatospora humi]MCC9311633.1 DMT family transporter [Kitasatospora humi]
MISILFAVLTALSNGTASVLQRRAAATAPEEDALRFQLLRDLLHRPVWLGGIAMSVVAAVCQAVALATGPIAIVQPIFVIELPFTLVLGGLLFHGSRFSRDVWVAIAAVAGGLALFLTAAAPSGGNSSVSPDSWPVALLATGLFLAVTLSIGLRVHGNARAAALGLAAACGYALTAALMKDAMARLDHGAGALFTGWQLYATAALGVGSLFVLQNALQAGSLAASQPMLSIGDALISTSYGVTLFAETLRTGWWLIPQVVAMGVVLAGCIGLSRSRLADGMAENSSKRGAPAAV